MLTRAESAEVSRVDPRRGRPVARWIHTPAADLAVALAWVPFVVVAHQLEADRRALGLFISATFLLSFAHQPLTLALVYGDREQFQLRRAIFTWSPVVFVVALVAAVQFDLVVVAVVAGLWNAEHTLMQRYGITRIYGRKAGQDDGRLERAMLFSWLALALVWVAGDPATPERVDRMGMAGTNRLAVDTLTAFRSAADGLRGVALVTVAAIALVWVWTEWRRGPAANPAKWLYVGATAALFVAILVDPIAGLMGYVGAHALEYFVVVHQSLGRRYGSATPEAALGSPPARGIAGCDPAPVRPLLGRIVAAPTGRLGFFAAYLAVVVGIVALLQWCGSYSVYFVVFFTLGGLHVFYDGFIWKLRRPAVARSLALPTS